jgi:hypothetical protein
MIKCSACEMRTFKIYGIIAWRRMSVRLLSQKPSSRTPALRCYERHSIGAWHARGPGCCRVHARCATAAIDMWVVQHPRSTGGFRCVAA